MKFDYKVILINALLLLISMFAWFEIGIKFDTMPGYFQSMNATAFFARDVQPGNSANASNSAIILLWADLFFNKKVRKSALLNNLTMTAISDQNMAVTYNKSLYNDELCLIYILAFRKKFHFDDERFHGKLSS